MFPAMIKKEREKKKLYLAKDILFNICWTQTIDPVVLVSIQYQ